MKLQNTICGLALVAVTCSVAVRAQDQNPNPTSPYPATPDSSMGPAPPGGRYAQRPAPAARGVSPADNADLVPGDPALATPDSNTLAGAQLFGVGSLGRSHNIFDPSLSFSELGQTLPPVPGQSNFLSITLLGGGLSLDRTWNRDHLTIDYSGGETLSRGQINADTQFHNLTVIQQIDWARWHLLLRDDFVASPGAAFSGTGMGGPGLLAQTIGTLESSLASIGQGFAPGETIQTGYTMRYNNAAVGQLEYSASRRSTFTFAASYGLLQFTDPGYHSSHMVNAQAGYDYALDPLDSFAVLASYGRVDFTGTANTTTNYIAALAYGRKITGRLAFQVAAGPEQIRSAAGASGFQDWYASVTTALNYQWRHGGYSLSYMRGLSSGSGVFLGAKTNTVSLGAHREFTRFLTGSLTGGYAMNDSLTPTGTPSVRFDDWFVGLNLGWRLGSHAMLNLNYSVLRQNNPAVCPVASCGVNGYQQMFGTTINWHLLRNE